MARRELFRQDQLFAELRAEIHESRHKSLPLFIIYEPIYSVVSHHGPFTRLTMSSAFHFVPS